MGARRRHAHVREGDGGQACGMQTHLRRCRSLDADEIAKSIVRSMGSAPFFIGFGIDGWMMNHLTAGMVASSSLWQFASGALLLPLFRTIAVCYSFYFDWLVLGEHRKKNSLRE